MLRLIIDSYSVEFYQNQQDSIQFNFYNPIFQVPSAIGLPDGTYPFLIPASDNNKKFFGFPESLSASPNSPSGFGGTKRVDITGVRPLTKIWTGRLYITEGFSTVVNVQFIYATSAQYSIQCVVGNARLDAFINNTKIKAFINGEAGTLQPTARLKVAHIKYYVTGADSNGMAFGAAISGLTWSLGSPAYKKGAAAYNYTNLAAVINANSTAARCTAAYDSVAGDLVLTALSLVPGQIFDLGQLGVDTSSGIYRWAVISENVQPTPGNNVVMSSGRYKVVNAVLSPETLVNHSDAVSVILNSITYTVPGSVSGPFPYDYITPLISMINNDSLNAGCTCAYMGTTVGGLGIKITFTANEPGLAGAFDSSQMEALNNPNWNWDVTDDFTWAQPYGDDITDFLNNVPADPTLPYCFTPHYNPSFYDVSANPDWTFNQVVNCFSFRSDMGSSPGYRVNYNTAIAAGTQVGGLNTSSTFHNYYTLVPFVKVAYVLQAVFAGLGIRVSSTFLADPEIQTLLFYNTVSLDAQQTLKMGTTIFQPCNLFQDNFDLSDHLPDITIASLLNGLCALFGLGKWYNYNTGVIQIEKIDAYIKNRKWDNELMSPFGIGNLYNWDGLEANTPLYELEPPDEFGFLINQAGDGSDKYQANNAYNVFSAPAQFNNVKNTGPVVISSIFGTLAMGTKVSFPSASYLDGQLMPMASQKGSSPMFNTGNNSFSPRLLFYRGLQQDASGNLYPLASSDVYDITGTIIANYALTYPGLFGLYTLFYKKWLQNRLANGRCIRTVYLTNRQLSRFTTSNKVMIKNQIFIIRSIKISAIPTKRGIYAAQCEIVKIN